MLGFSICSKKYCNSCCDSCNIFSKVLGFTENVGVDFISKNFNLKGMFRSFIMAFFIIIDDDIITIFPSFLSPWKLVSPHQRGYRTRWKACKTWWNHYRSKNKVPIFTKNIHVLLKKPTHSPETVLATCHSTIYAFTSTHQCS